MAVSSTSSSTAGSVTSVDDMLANAKAAAASNSSSGTKSAVQKLLDAHGDNGTTDTVELSPVAKLLQAKTTAAAKTSYFDSDEYLTAKVAQLKGQLAIYTTLPGLDPSGGVVDSITKDVNELVKKQQDKLKASQAEAKAKQDELAKTQANQYQGVASADMLSRSKALATTGKLPDGAVSSDVQAMLDKLKGSSVNTTA